VIMLKTKHVRLFLGLLSNVFVDFVG